MPRRKELTIEQRNTLERYAIGLSRDRFEKAPPRDGAKLKTAFVDGFMEGAQLTPAERAELLDIAPIFGTAPTAPRKRSPRKKAAVATEVVERTEAAS